MNTSITSITPFLKWAGGKRWLLRSHKMAFDLNGIERYVEPFVGSAAVFFSLQPKRALLNDANAELIETYKAIKSDWKSVLDLLRKHQRSHSDDYYYQVRDSAPTAQATRAARFIYLNRTCFNGLYRVNRRGEFNVPRGTKNSVLLDSDDFELISRKLSKVTLQSGDFERVVDQCGSGDFIYADPPYTVKHNNNGFIKYNEKLFSWSDQERLKDALIRASDRGARVLVSNADHPSIQELYADATCAIVKRHSVMASESERRKLTTELLISIGR
ncbi:DNA adenine methylase [Luteimonas aquatica]|uniref:DNA adenine methylase n=1 Tax=Luteimonas aquatica TaxID=450364 RepID=UPI001F5A07DC|nr:Dam family site-specific DNA-(adenine-N6)-methyltransferase [Luteimonas aquatica]